MPTEPASAPEEPPNMDALMILSEMAAGSPRTRALASLNMTHEQLASYTDTFRSFLAQTAPDDESEPAGPGADVDAASSPKQPTVPASSSAEVDEASPAKDSTNSQHASKESGTSGSVRPSSHGKTREPEPETDAPDDASSRVAASMATTTDYDDATSAPASESDVLPDRPKPKLKLKLLPPSASNASKAGSTHPNPNTADGQSDSAETSTRASKRRAVVAMRSMPSRAAKKRGHRDVPSSQQTDASDAETAAPTGPSFQFPFSSLQTPRRDLPKLPIPVTSPAPYEDEELPFKLPPGPRSNEKPPWSYAALIGQAILASPQQKLSLNQIYTFISMAYPFYAKDQAGWRNSIRHNLSLNGSFMKVPREAGARGKGSLWTINPQDLECFKGGGYARKGSGSSRKRKAKDEEDDDSEEDDYSSVADPLPATSTSKRRKGDPDPPAFPFFPGLPPGAAPMMANGPYGQMPIVYYPMYAVSGPDGTPQYYAAVPMAGGAPAPFTIPAPPPANPKASGSGKSSVPTSTAFQNNPYLAFSQQFTAARKNQKPHGTLTRITAPAPSSSMKSQTTAQYSTPTRHTSTTSYSEDSPMPGSSPLPPSSPLSPTDALDSSPLPQSSPLPPSSLPNSPSGYILEMDDDVESEDEIVIEERSSSTDRRVKPRTRRPMLEAPLPTTSDEEELAATTSTPKVPSPKKKQPSPRKALQPTLSAQQLLEQFRPVGRKHPVAQSSPIPPSRSLQLQSTSSLLGAKPRSSPRDPAQITPKGKATLTAGFVSARSSGNTRPSGTFGLGGLSLSGNRAPGLMTMAAAAQARANGSPPPRSRPLTTSVSTSVLPPPRTAPKGTPVADAEVKASSSSSMVSTPPDDDNAEVQVRAGQEVVSDVESNDIFGSDASDDESTTAATPRTPGLLRSARPLKRLEFPPPIAKVSPSKTQSSSDDVDRAVRTPSPPPRGAVVEPQTPQNMDGSATSAQDFIARVLGAAAHQNQSKIPEPPTTPNNLRAGASVDVAFGHGKAPSPLTPFARPVSPTTHKPLGSMHTPTRFANNTPFRTPPPKRPNTQRRVSGGERLGAISTLTGEASGSSSFRTPHYPQSHLLGGSAGPDFGLRDMFGLSPFRTPLGARGSAGDKNGSSSASASVLSADAIFKRSLLPPSPFRTPTSSSRYTQPGDEDDGVEHAEDDGVDERFQEEMARAMNGAGSRRSASDDTSGESSQHHAPLDPALAISLLSYDPNAHPGAEELARLQEAPVTPHGSSVLFRTRSSQSPSMSPGNWRMF